MKKICILSVLIVFTFNSYADDRPKVYSLLNKTIFISNNWAGETITLVKENDEYFIIRQILGSGRPVVAKLKYQVKFYSDYQIRFSKIISSDIDRKNTFSEEFILGIIDDGKIELFLNGLEVVIVRIENENL
jgi:hypothetical protein